MSTHTKTSSERLIFRALQPIQSLLEAPMVTEVLVNDAGQVFCEESGVLKRVDVSLGSNEDLETLVRLLSQSAGHVLQEHDFELDTTLQGPPAVRVHAGFGPTSPRGVNLTLRRMGSSQVDLKRLIEEFETLTPAAVQFLRIAIWFRQSLLISGGTGSGKTTILNCLAELMPPSDRIVVIEDTSELSFIHQKNVVHLLTRGPDFHGRGEVTVRDLFRSSLRMRPDRIVIGEVRGGEAFDLIQALGSGHSGSLCTIHADSALLALIRLQNLALTSGTPVPAELVQRQIAEVLGFVVQIGRLANGSRKVLRIDRVAGCDGGVWGLRPIFGITNVSGVGPGALQFLGKGDAWLGQFAPRLLESEAPALWAEMHAER